jgi:hypothetical protein
MFGPTAHGLQVPSESAFDFGLDHMVKCFNLLLSTENEELRGSITLPIACLTKIIVPGATSLTSSTGKNSGSGSNVGTVASKPTSSVDSGADSVGRSAVAASVDQNKLSAGRKLGKVSRVSSIDEEHDSTSTLQPVSLVFPNLAKDGFRTGCPDRISNPQWFDLFKSKLKRVVDLMHQAGVIHCDLYFSNIMWRVNPENGAMEIKLIDFDISHRLCELDFAPKVRKRLEKYYADSKLSDLKLEFGTQHDLRFLSVLELPVDDRTVNHWLALASNDVSLINKSFRALFLIAMSIDR